MQKIIFLFLVLISVQAKAEARNFLGTWEIIKTTCLKDKRSFRSSGWIVKFDSEHNFESLSKLSRCKTKSIHTFNNDAENIYISKGQMQKNCEGVITNHEVPAFQVKYILSPEPAPENLKIEAQNSYCNGSAEYEFLKKAALNAQFGL